MQHGLEHLLHLLRLLKLLLLELLGRGITPGNHGRLRHRRRNPQQDSHAPFHGLLEHALDGRLLRHEHMARSGGGGDKDSTDEHT